MKILRVICSPRGLASESYRLSQIIISQLIDKHRDHELIVTERDVTGLAHIDAIYADTLSRRRDPLRAPFDEGTFPASEQLIRELESADYVVIATPLHNLTVPSALKAWLDHVIQADRTFRITPEGKIGLMRDRPVFVAVAAGGLFSTDHAEQSNFLTPYLKVALATIGLQNVKLFAVERTAQNEPALHATREKIKQDIAFYFLSDAAKRNSLRLSIN